MILQGGTALITQDERIECKKADIRIEGAHITELKTHLSAREGEEVVDAGGKLILPGLVNAHYHSYSNLLKGTTWGEPLEVWTPDTVALGGRMDEKRMQLSAQLGIVEMLRCGVTSCLDHIPHLNQVDAIARVYAQSGFRASIAPMIADRSDDQILPGLAQALQAGGCPAAINHFRSMDEVTQLYEGWIKDWHRPGGTLRVAVGINSPQRASITALETACEISRKHRLKVHAHFLETSWQAQAAAQDGEDPLSKLEKADLLNSDLSLAHCIWLSKAQWKRLEKAGSCVVHNPTSNLLLGSGKMELTSLIGNGLRVAVGSDGSNCATGHNILEITRTAILLSRLEHPDYWNWLTQQDALSMMTINGSAASGWPGETGAIAPGMLADIVLMDERTSALLPAYDILTQLLLQQDSIRATDVLIHGAWMMRNKQILCLDENAIYQEAIEQQTELSSEFSTILQNQSIYKNIISNEYQKRVLSFKG
ncbi:MAG TPA: amidohydrolase family protein [Clostridia bacterium]|nr:amidohydrolase family protein [Clostridia bacterium]